MSAGIAHSAAPVEYEVPMVTDKRSSDPDNIRRKVNKHRRKRSELDHSHCGRYLIGIAAIDPRKPTRKNKMRRRADRYEFGEALNYAEDDRLYEIHLSVNEIGNVS